MRLPANLACGCCVQAQAKADKASMGKSQPKPRRDDLEDKDDQDTFYAELQKRREEEGDEEIVEYDEDG